MSATIKTTAKTPAAPAEPTTLSNIPVKREYDASDLAGRDLAAEVGRPGSFPFTRGLKSSGYRTNPWTMRMFAGHKTAKGTTGRFKYLLEHGQPGLSTAFG